MRRAWTLCAAGACLAASIAVVRSQTASKPFPVKAEFHFVRMEYTDRRDVRRPFGRGGWWLQDWPEADDHFAQGVRRLTRVDIGENRHMPLVDPGLFDHPWIYATQVGYWDLKKAEVDRLRTYLLRGGFLVVDDFHGPRDWTYFKESMEQLFPEQPILDIAPDDPLFSVLYEIRERTFIPGLRHLRRGPGGTVVAEPQYTPPHWRALHDPKGRMVVAINFNMDVGDAWEHADLPEYPAEMTQLAYRFGLNYILYAMTH